MEKTKTDARASEHLPMMMSLVTGAAAAAMAHGPIISSPSSLTSPPPPARLLASEEEAEEEEEEDYSAAAAPSPTTVKKRAAAAAATAAAAGHRSNHRGPSSGDSTAAHSDATTASDLEAPYGPRSTTSSAASSSFTFRMFHDDSGSSVGDADHLAKHTRSISPSSPSPFSSSISTASSTSQSSRNGRPHRRKPFDQSLTNDISLDAKPSGQERFAREFAQGSSVFPPQLDHTPLVPVVIATKYHPTILKDEAEQELTFEIMDLLQSSLSPTHESIVRRRKFIAKIKYILSKEWPDKGIRVHPFGSTVNGLGTSRSDVDLCLTTPWEDPVNSICNMHVLASCLRANGMTKICTVTKAKVPICKFFDPELRISCDINVNNTIALRNTTLVKLYVELDPRVRPVILIIKHWAKQRVLNDAKGGTLSSYCWVMMVLNFLQTRDPPIIPCLHQLYFDRLKDRNDLLTPIIIDGVDCSFEEDITSLKDFGRKNNETLGGLVYAFFRQFAFEFDYETQVVSVRHGRLLSKKEKEWDQDVDRMCRHLCVEEPFTPHRNLANSADLLSVKGLRMEFQRALRVLEETASVEAACEPFVLPPKASPGPHTSSPRSLSGSSRIGAPKLGNRHKPPNLTVDVRSDVVDYGPARRTNDWSLEANEHDASLLPMIVLPSFSLDSATLVPQSPISASPYPMLLSPGLVYPAAIPVLSGYIHPMSYDEAALGQDQSAEANAQAPTVASADGLPLESVAFVEYPSTPTLLNLASIASASAAYISPVSVSEDHESGSKKETTYFNFWETEPEAVETGQVLAPPARLTNRAQSSAGRIRGYEGGESHTDYAYRTSTASGRRVSSAHWNYHSGSPVPHFDASQFSLNAYSADAPSDPVPQNFRNSSPSVESSNGIPMRRRSSAHPSIRPSHGGWKQGKRDTSSPIGEEAFSAGSWNGGDFSSHTESYRRGWSRSSPSEPSDKYAKSVKAQDRGVPVNKNKWQERDAEIVDLSQRSIRPASVSSDDCIGPTEGENSIKPALACEAPLQEDVSPLGSPLMSMHSVPQSSNEPFVPVESWQYNLEQHRVFVNSKGSNLPSALKSSLRTAVIEELTFSSGEASMPAGEAYFVDRSLSMSAEAHQPPTTDFSVTVAGNGVRLTRNRVGPRKPRDSMVASASEAVRRALPAKPLPAPVQLC